MLRRRQEARPGRALIQPGAPHAEKKGVTLTTSLRRLHPLVQRGIADARVRAAARLAATTLCLAAFSLAGMGIALRAFSTASYQVGPAQMSISTSFADHGSVDVYVPIVDWGVRAEPYTAPIRMSATLVSVEPHGGAAHAPDPRRCARPPDRGRGRRSGRRT